MTYKLYNRLGSGGFVAEAALTLIGAPFELELIESTPGTPLPDGFRAINPWRQVPTLVLADGTVMTESAAILIHLAAAHPEAALGPAPGTSDHARFLRWLVFLSANVYEAVLRRGYPERFTTDPAGTEAIADAARRRMGEALGVIEAELAEGDFLLGPEMSAADLFLAMLTAWNRGADALPRCAALTHRVAAHPKIAPVWQRNFDHRLDIKWGRP